MNQERPNETRAKRLVEHVMRVQLEHHDTHGGVDYLSPDGDVALEVTAVTSGEKDGAWKALRKSEAKGAPDAELQGCWLIFVPDDLPDMKTFVQRVQPSIVELELVGESYFDSQPAAIHTIERGPLASVYRLLLEAGVERAIFRPHERRPDNPDHKHRLWVSPGSGGSASGSDEALDLLLDELRPKTDNVRKLAASGADQRHLFVWINDNTSFGIARPLSHQPPSGVDDHWGLPSDPPELDPAITHLWVVHARSRSGWLWDGITWRELQEPANG
jgi:hypothetical protein